MCLRLFILIAIGILATSLCGCKSDNEGGNSSPEITDLVGAKIVHEIPTRTSINEADEEFGRFTMAWSDQDTLGILDFSSGKALPYVLVKGAGSDKAVFAGSGQVSSYQAFYPYGMLKGVSDHLIYFNFPSYQSYKLNDIPDRSFPMLSNETASSDRVELLRLFSMLKISLTGDDVVYGILLETNAPDVLISGDATVDTRTRNVTMSKNARNSIYLAIPDIKLDPKIPTDFFIAVPAQDYPGGLSLSVELQNGIAIKDFPEITSLGTTLFQAITVDLSAIGLRFEDPNFKNYLLDNFDENNDLIITEEEALKVTDICITSMNIHSLDGIQHFINLESLKASHNHLKTIDLSQNKLLKYINLYNNELETLDLSNNINIEIISADYNNLQSINLSGCIHLTRLGVEENSLTNLDVSDCLDLWQLRCQFNQLSELRIPEESVLKELFCYKNNLSSLTVHSKELDILKCQRNSLTELDISDCPSITQIDACANQFTEIEFSGFEKLTNLSIAGCPGLSRLVCKHNPSLINLNCGSNNLNGIELEDCPNILSLEISNNYFQSIDLKPFKNLEYLSCAFNQFKELDLSSNTQLEELLCSDNALEKLDLSKCAQLGFLYFSGNPINELDLSVNQMLKWIQCNDLSVMKELDVSPCSQLEYLECQRSSLETIYIAKSQVDLYIIKDDNTTVREK